MVDDLEERLSRYRADLDAAVAADLARRQPVSREARFDDADPLLLDTDHRIPLEPTSAPYERRRVMLVATLVAAAVTTLVVVALVAARDDAVNPADQPAPSVTVPPTTPPRALFGTPDEQLVPGTYFVDEVDGTPTARIFVTIGAGWSNFIDGHGIGKLEGAGPEGDVGFITFSRPDRVFSDACHWSDGFYPGPVTTLDGLVAALSEQGGWVDVTAPSDISVNGYNGKAFQRTTPVMYSCDTDEAFRPRFPTRQDREDGSEPAFRSWENENASNFGGTYYESGQLETVLVLDVDGTVVVINANLFPGSSAADRAEFAAVLDSIRIDRG